MTSLTQLNCLIEQIQTALVQLEKKIDRLAQAKGVLTERADTGDGQPDCGDRYRELCRKLRQLTEEFDGQ